MRLKFGFLGRLTAALIIFVVFLGGIRFAAHSNFPVVDKATVDDVFGSITMARPLISYRALALVFVDGKKYPPVDLARRIARTGVAVAIIDAGSAVKALTDDGRQCLKSDSISAPLASLVHWASAPQDMATIVAGVDNGALIPFVSAIAEDKPSTMNLSVNFSIDLPEHVEVCTPLTDQGKVNPRRLTGAPSLKGRWLAAWADEPEGNTAVFVRGIKNAAMDIAAYNTPLDQITINEIQNLVTRMQGKSTGDMPIVPLPGSNDTAQTEKTVTFFYSGDGGWRDLDRDVGEILAKHGYPVVGVDVLRYFWSAKDATQAARDLSALMQHYRTEWKARRFVLAGYSFGADILPALYNHLPENDKKDIDLLVLLALGTNADFEIHVAGWVEKTTSGVPILPELLKVPSKKILCIYGQEEKNDTACNSLPTTGAKTVELPGGHHFDQNYPKLASLLISAYEQAGVTKNN